MKKLLLEEARSCGKPEQPVDSKVDEKTNFGKEGIFQVDGGE